MTPRACEVIGNGVGHWSGVLHPQRSRSIPSAVRDHDCGAMGIASARESGARTAGIAGASKALEAVLARARKVAPTESTVLVNGETGTGRELLARTIRNWSGRANGPLVSVNCAAIPQTLIPSDVVGHERGAFTGALQRRHDRFELAAGGTLFLDEVGELSGGDAGAPVARAPRTRVRTAGRNDVAGGGCASRRGHEPRSPKGDCRRQLPQRSLLSTRRLPTRDHPERQAGGLQGRSARDVHDAEGPRQRGTARVRPVVAAVGSGTRDSTSKEMIMFSKSNTTVRLRQALTITALVMVWISWLSGRAHAQANSPVTKINAAAATANIDVQPLRGNVSALMGSGGDITVLANDDGKLMVDTGIAVSRTKLS